MAAAVFLITYPRRARSYSHITLKVPPIAPRVSHVANPRACQCVTCAVVALAWLLLVTAFFLGLGGASIGPAQERAADTESRRSIAGIMHVQQLQRASRFACCGE